MDATSIIDKFKNRETKAKDTFDIYEITKEEAYEFVRKYHYLGDAKFFAMYSYGLYLKDTHVLVGCATYSLPQGTFSLKGWFGIEDNSCHDVLELSRLCMLPTLNGSNATSYLLGNSMKKLKQHNVRAIITLADAHRHIGSIYQVCNFTYYGLAKVAKDFWREDGACNPRGETGSMHGVYLPRTRKHRYAFILDKSLKCLYDEEPHPTTKGVTIQSDCCSNTMVVYDYRFDEYYTCPKCTSKITKISQTDYNNAIEYSKNHTEDEQLQFVEDIILKTDHENGVKEIIDLW